MLCHLQIQTPHFTSSPIPNLHHVSPLTHGTKVLHTSIVVYSHPQPNEYHDLKNGGIAHPSHPQPKDVYSHLTHILKDVVIGVTMTQDVQCTLVTAIKHNWVGDGSCHRYEGQSSCWSAIDIGEHCRFCHRYAFLSSPASGKWFISLHISPITLFFKIINWIKITGTLIHISYPSLGFKTPFWTFISTILPIYTYIPWIQQLQPK